jgi:hypothetical protein
MPFALLPGTYEQFRRSAAVSESRYVMPETGTPTWLLVLHKKRLVLSADTAHTPKKHAWVLSCSGRMFMIWDAFVNTGIVCVGAVRVSADTRRLCEERGMPETIFSV